MPSQAKSSRASRSPWGSVAMAAAMSAHSRVASSRASTSEKRSDAVDGRVHQPGRRAETAGLTLAMAGQEIARDPVQPGPSLRSIGVEARPLLECDAKELAQQRVSVVGADPAHEVPEHRRGMPVEQLAEGGRRLERARDDLGIGARTHHLMFPARSDTVRTFRREGHGRVSPVSARVQQFFRFGPYGVSAGVEGSVQWARWYGDVGPRGTARDDFGRVGSLSR